MNTEELIKTKQVKVAIIGMGYVGLPHALEIANVGMDVCGIDVQQKRVDSLNGGKSYIQDVKDGALQAIIDFEKIPRFSRFFPAGPGGCRDRVRAHAFGQIQNSRHFLH